jgi:hypothetical protein
MGKHEEIWAELRDLDDRVTRLEDCKPTACADLEREVERLKSPAECWRSIVDVLNDIAPGWQAESDNHEQAAIAVIYALKAERDALRARIEGGTVVYDGPHGWWETEGPYSKLKALIIDRDHIAPIAEDERRGERRVAQQKADCVNGLFMFRRNGGLMPEAASRSYKGGNDRRRTVGTIADRKEATHDPA